jgi:hypothetical protein
MATIVSEKFVDPTTRETFIKEYVLQAGNPAGSALAFTEKFDFVQPVEGVLAAKLVKAANGAIKAHYLRWKTKEVTSMTLDANADYFFTSQLTNCSFAVFGEPTAPTVYHTAATIESTSKKKQLEKAVNKEGMRERRMSRSGASGTTPLHQYTGQDAVKSPASAFVYGVRDEKSGVWTFASQVVEGNVEGLIPKKDGKLPTILNPFFFKPWYD